jgi:hypothetical protein
VWFFRTKSRFVFSWKGLVFETKENFEKEKKKQRTLEAGKLSAK